MLRYFLLICIFLTLLAVGIFGFRGQRKTARPFEIFPDMDTQDKVMGQAASGFFSDGMGSRLPVPGTLPHASDGGIFPLEFGEGQDGYYYTGILAGTYGNGMPGELGLTEANVRGFLMRGEERFGIYCAICHGSSGNGKGVLSKYQGMSGIADLLHDNFKQSAYPDGMLFETITKGRKTMGAYGSALPVRDRWAIVAYLRALQEANAVPK